QSDERSRARTEIPRVRAMGARRCLGCPADRRSGLADRAARRRARAHATVGRRALIGSRRMFEGFTQTQIDTTGARINLRHGGSGPPLLLLHGNPLTHVMWHKIAPRLAQDFTVVAADLRGYGDSSKPDGGADHAGYSFRAMGQDQAEVMAALGFRDYFVCGHDRGARVAHRMGLDYPQRGIQVAVLDIGPTPHRLNK